MKKCTICKEPIILTPSAQERARRFGGKPSDYTNIFSQHSDCTVRARSAASITAMKKANEKYEEKQARRVFVT